MSIEERLRASDPAPGRGRADVLDREARALAHRMAEARPRRRRALVPLTVANVVGALALGGGAAAIADPSLMPWVPAYVGDLDYERTIPLDSGALHCTISIGAERDGQAGDGMTERLFEQATRFLASIDIDELDRATASSDNAWAKARLVERGTPDPDETYINSTFVGEISDEFADRGYLRQGIALQSAYGCEAAE